MADPLTLPSKPDELAAWLQEHAPHLTPALAEAAAPAAGDGDGDDEKKGRKGKANGNGGGERMSESETPGLTEADVRRMLQESQSGTPTVEEFEAQLQERMEQTLQEREEQRTLSIHAARLIEAAEGIPPRWKADLKARYAMLPSGPPAALLVESAVVDDEGKELTPQQVIEARVAADVEHTLELIAEATGRPRVKGEGGAKRDPAEASGGGKGEATPYWRTRFVSMGLAESEEKAVEAFGGKVTGD